MQADNSWVLRVDPQAWRLRPGDTIGDGEHMWTIVTALLKTVPGYPAADYIAVTATLNPPEVP